MRAFGPLVGLVASVAAVTTNYVQGDPARFTYTSMKTPLSGPCDVSEGPDGLVYVQEVFANTIARYNQHTGELTEFNIPFTVGPLPNQTLPLPGNAKAELVSCAIRNGFDGKMYFSNGVRNQLVQFDVHTEKIQIFTPPGLTQPVGNLEPLNDLTTAPDGVYMTQTTMNTIVKFDYETHQFKYFTVPTLAAIPLGIYYASDGGIWFLEFAASKVGRLDRSTGTIKEFSVPITGAAPVVMRAETRAENGDYLLWFAAVIGGSTCSVNERSGNVTCYEESPTANFVENAQDYQDNIWLSHVAQDTLGVFNPKHQNYTEIIMPGTIAPTPVSVPLFGGSGIYSKPVGNPFTGNGTGNAIWFTQLTTNRLVRYDLDGLVY